MSAFSVLFTRLKMILKSSQFLNIVSVSFFARYTSCQLDICVSNIWWPWPHTLQTHLSVRGSVSTIGGTSSFQFIESGSYGIGALFLSSSEGTYSLPRTISLSLLSFFGSLGISLISGSLLMACFNVWPLGRILVSDVATNHENDTCFGNGLVMGSTDCISYVGLVKTPEKLLQT